MNMDAEFSRLNLELGASDRTKRDCWLSICRKELVHDTRNGVGSNSVNGLDKIGTYEIDLLIEAIKQYL